MTYTIEYSKEADRTLRKWKKSNPQLFKKATKILMDIMHHPRTSRRASAFTLRRKLVQLNCYVKKHYQTMAGGPNGGRKPSDSAASSGAERD